MKLKYGLYIILILTISLVSCGQNSDSYVITDKDEMLDTFSAINTAISRFHDLKSGTIISEFTGTFMPGLKAVKDEMSFKRTEDGIHYVITETYLKGEPLVIDKLETNGELPESAYIYYPNKPLEYDSFENAIKVTVIQKEKGREYRIDYDLNEVILPENTYLEELYTSYTIDGNGILTEMYVYRSYYQQEPQKLKTNEENEYFIVRLVEYEK